MRVIKINRTRVSAKVLAEIEAVLVAGGVVVFPTETAYGLAAIPGGAGAKKIFAIKGRVDTKALPFIAASLAVVKKYFVLEGVAAKLARAHWPGPLTIVLKPRDAKTRRACGASVAIRVPASAWARAIAGAAGGVCTSTSANVSGQPSAYSAKDVVRQMKRRKTQPDLVLDAGKLPKSEPSTIVKVGKRGVEVLRPGAIAKL